MVICFSCLSSIFRHMFLYVYHLFTKRKAERNRLTLSYPVCFRYRIQKAVIIHIFMQDNTIIFRLYNLFKGVNFFNSFRKVDR